MAAIGRWNYASGAAGTVTIIAGARLMSMSCSSASDAATVRINGGDLIHVYSGETWSDQIPPVPNVLSPNDPTLEGPFNIVFTGTRNYYVSWMLIDSIP